MSNLMIAKRGSLQVTKWTPTESHSILPAMSLVSGIVHFQPDDSRWFLDFHGFPPLEIPSNFWFLGHPFYHILSIDNIYIYFKSFYPILSHGFQIMSSGSGIFTFFLPFFLAKAKTASPRTARCWSRWPHVADVADVDLMWGTGYWSSIDERETIIDISIDSW